MKRWEMWELSLYNKDFVSVKRRLLAEGWEPFAITDNGGKGPTMYYFKREVAGQDNEVSDG